MTLFRDATGLRRNIIEEDQAVRTVLTVEVHHLSNPRVCCHRVPRRWGQGSCPLFVHYRIENWTSLAVSGWNHLARPPLVDRPFRGLVMTGWDDCVWTGSQGSHGSVESPRKVRGSPRTSAETVASECSAAGLLDHPLVC